MALYHEAQKVLLDILQDPGPWKSVFSRIDQHTSNSHFMRQRPGRSLQLRSLIVGLLKWSKVLSHVIDNAGLLRIAGNKITPAVALLACYDLLISGHGVAAAKGSHLRQVVEKNSARLRSELTRARIRAGMPSLEAWKTAVYDEAKNRQWTSKGPDGSKLRLNYPRWVRINTVETTLEFQLESGVFRNWRIAPSIKEMLLDSSHDYDMAIDPDIENLVAIKSRPRLHKTVAYAHGKIIFQNKASCFPAILLDPQPQDGNVIDACAAPGNKTTHLAALIQSSRASSNAETSLPPQIIFALDVSWSRTESLRDMIATAGVYDQDQVRVLHQDFLDLKLGNSSSFGDVGAILVDAHCSGSGMIKRDEEDTFSALVLPLRPSDFHLAPEHHKQHGLKRKRDRVAVVDTGNVASQPQRRPSGSEDDATLETPDPEQQDLCPDSPALVRRLQGLASFQIRLLVHALSWPGVRKVVYSTCSIYAIENEHVVLEALYNHGMREMGWQVLPRNKQVKCMREWHHRGDYDNVINWLETKDRYSDSGDLMGKGMETKFDTGVALARKFTEACLRCNKGTEDATIGFFAVALVKHDRDAEESHIPAKTPNTQGGASMAGEEPFKIEGQHSWIREADPMAVDKRISMEEHDAKESEMMKDCVNEEEWGGLSDAGPSEFIDGDLG